MSNRSSLYKRHRFPPEIIQYAVWLYHRFSLSHRDIEDLLAERGISVTMEMKLKFTEMQDVFPGGRVKRERSAGPRAGCPQPNLRAILGIAPFR